MSEDDECSVEGCEQAATETVEVRARASVFQPREYIMHELTLQVPICPGHKRLLSDTLWNVWGPSPRMTM